MISDHQTNLLYLADTLPKKQSIFFPRFELILKEQDIAFKLLPHTKDIWAVDYMPVQVRPDKFIQFTYNPDYLQYKKWSHTISDVDAICAKLGILPVKSNLVVDGGNIVKAGDKAIMCDKVFKENAHLGLSEKQIIKKLESLLEVDKIIFVPREPGDYTGHADGMVRFLDDRTVLVNNYANRPDFQKQIRLTLHNAGLDWIEIPYRPNGNTANGVYINYLQMKGLVMVPIFDMEPDEKAIKLFERYFQGQVVPLESHEIAKEGGVLNCISWNILA